jgi:hypothetical protein
MPYATSAAAIETRKTTSYARTAIAPERSRPQVQTPVARQVERARELTPDKRATCRRLRPQSVSNTFEFRMEVLQYLYAAGPTGVHEDVLRPHHSRDDLAVPR